MLSHEDDYWNAWPQLILGAEGDDNPGGDDDPSDSGDDDDEEDEPNPATPGNSDTDVEALRKALAAERRQSKKLARENARLAGAQQTQADKDLTEVQRAQQAEQAASDKASRLAAGLLKRDLNAAIEAAARKHNFLDVTDAIDGVDRSALSYDQDDEDPTDIEIDLATVETAVKALAAKKPHFISKGTDDGGPTGSKGGGSRRSQPTSEDKLKGLYSSL